MAVGGTAKQERGLTKRVASAVTTGGPHPRAVRLGSRLHLWGCCVASAGPGSWPGMFWC